ncbi:DNA lyase [Bradyrhizobium canariense]|uniref:8-oxoguanine DNA glycosylase n=1 Tax=Bradyrhizobium canariense TaxID=255045 RepID=UPI003CC80E38
MANGGQICEEELWHELACCILSSQVPYSLARAAADRIRECGMLAVDRRLDDEECEGQVRSALMGAFMIEGRKRRYRFPNSKARQLSLTRSAILKRFGTLSAALSELDDTETARRWFVENAPGLGPKQASMFLRSCRAAYDLAIIDRHVLEYMHIAGLRRSATQGAAGYARYLEDEVILRHHSQARGYRLGLFDYAVWIVMRVAGRTLAEGKSA